MAASEGHPVKDIVLPLVVVLALVANALMVGISWGRFSQRLDTIDLLMGQQDRRVESLEKGAQDLRDRVHDVEREAIEDRKGFQGLENYTRGRIDRLPWHPPPAR